MNPKITICAAVLLSGLAFGNITVIQGPPLITAFEGETVDLNCTCLGPSLIAYYTWYLNTQNGIEVSNKTRQYRGRVFLADRIAFLARKDASLKITDIKVHDSGTYYCKVEYIKYGAACGPGTKLTVTYRVTDTTTLWCIRTVIIIEVILFATVLYRRRCLNKVNCRLYFTPKPRVENIYEEINFTGERRKYSGKELAEGDRIDIEKSTSQTIAPAAN